MLQCYQGSPGAWITIDRTQPPFSCEDYVLDALRPIPSGRTGVCDVTCSPLSVWMLALLVLPYNFYPLYASEGTGSRVRVPDTGLSEEQKILHALNRLGYGPRPGEVKRIKRIGIAIYIEQQLQPETNNS